MSRPQSLLFVGVALTLATALTLGGAHGMEASQLPLNAVVQFGPAHPQPAPPAHHTLVPDEVTILKGGTVTFQVNGGGHGVAIYPVSARTTREDIEQDLCQTGPGCAAELAFPQHLVTDGKGDLIIDTGVFVPPPPPGSLPYFDYATGRVLAAIGGSAIFLNGSTAAPVPPATVPAPGVRLEHRFEKTGRFLVICMNRFHAINDHMFGFVNVVGDGSDDDSQ